MNKDATRARAVAAAHDLSSVGRCALTVVIPTLSAMGVQVCPLPTAVLSAHTGGYTGIASRDLTDYMDECVAHWQALNLSFDAVYSGYLANTRQIQTVAALIGWQRSANGALAVVDPVMGDEGAMYQSMPADMPRLMRTLCREADLITPNLTEAALLTGEPYSIAPRSPRAIDRMLAALDAPKALITSVPLEDGRWANVLKRRGEAGYWQVAFEPVPVHYPGTGDLFASVLTGALVTGSTPEWAMARATRYVRRVVSASVQAGGAVRAGVELEASLLHITDEAGLRMPERIIP